MLLKTCFFVFFWEGGFVRPAARVLFQHFVDGPKTSDTVTLGNEAAALLRARLHAGLAEVHLERQRPRLLAGLRLFDGDGDHGAQVVRVDFVHVVQELFVSVDAQLGKRIKNGKERWNFCLCEDVLCPQTLTHWNTPIMRRLPFGAFLFYSEVGIPQFPVGSFNWNAPTPPRGQISYSESQRSLTLPSCPSETAAPPPTVGDSV